VTDNVETVTLSRPVKAHGGEISEIKLKEPTARSFFQHGEAFKVKVTTDDAGASNVEFEYNNAIMAKFLSDMAGLDDIVLSTLRASDYMQLRTRAAYMIIGVSGQNPSET
jgi:Phage tail assembly chaperone proteins, E, or 41 or 14